MVTLIDTFGMSKGLLIIHLVPFLVALFIWRNIEAKNSVGSIIVDILGYLATCVALLLTLIFLVDGEPTAEGNAGSWFLIYSVVTLGLVPAVTLTCYFLSGRVIGRWLSWFKARSVIRNAQFGRSGQT